MVLQRNQPIKIWGWASKGENISVTFNNKVRRTTATANGDWQVEFSKMKAGGPYTMHISGANEIDLGDILIGDVWLCAGQSNMEHQLYRHDVTYTEEIKYANFPEIRHFKVPKRTNLSEPNKKLNGGNWEVAVANEVPNFSAVAYFFAKEIYKENKVPIGLINASVGGTPIEAWTSEKGFSTNPTILETIEKNKDTVYINSIKEHNKNTKDQIVTTTKDKGQIGEIKWFDTDFKPTNWRKINIPGYWEDQGIRGLNGTVWYRKEIEIPKSMLDKEAVIFLGRIVDADQLYINGKEIGNTTYQYPQRKYAVAKDVLHEGKNVFVIKVTNYNGKGGFVTDKPYALIAENDTINLKGYWHYKVGEVFEPADPSLIQISINEQNEPTALYNAMVAPYTQLKLSGILWYQGESNSGRPKQYANLLTGLITDWRNQFNQPNVPFIYAQLPNFMEVNYLPEESNWAEFRASQLAGLSLPNTAMTVNIELGEWNDIHPENKKDVGERMALAAQKIVYAKDVVYSGPMYKDYSTKEGKVEISFYHVGSGLMAKNNEPLSQFAIAGEDKKFTWAQAKIEGDKVVVWSEKITDPKYVRYAWADNPDNPNLYNKEGLPASPFSTE